MGIPFILRIGRNIDFFGFCIPKRRNRVSKVRHKYVCYLIGIRGEVSTGEKAECRQPEGRQQCPDPLQQFLSAAAMQSGIQPRSVKQDQRIEEDIDPVDIDICRHQTGEDGYPEPEDCQRGADVFSKRTDREDQPLRGKGKREQIHRTETAYLIAGSPVIFLQEDQKQRAGILPELAERRIGEKQNIL